jgi:hypothetical protein
MTWHAQERTGQLAARIPYAEQTIRNLMSSGELVEGEHYFKRRGRVILSFRAG